MTLLMTLETSLTVVTGIVPDGGMSWAAEFPSLEAVMSAV